MHYNIQNNKNLCYSMYMHVYVHLADLKSFHIL